jgi:Cu(I)/Ag(I) efflux system membrane fusion protein
MFVEGVIKRMDASSMNMRLKIPASAVLWTGVRSVVYVKPNANEPVFEMKEIVLGAKFGDYYEVIEGLNSGDEIVTNGTFTVDAAAQLQGKKSMMNKEGGKTMTGHEGHLGMMEPMSSMDTHSNMNERMKVSKEFQNQLKKVFDRYITLKNGLIEDNSEEVAKDAKKLLTDLSKVDMKLLNMDAHSNWMPLEKVLKTAANSISNSRDIAAQRKQFKQLSKHLTTAIELFGINAEIYQQFCPMADNNKGAHWLSKEEKVFNPYFGQSMLKCGEVKQVIK